ncbi:MAG: ATP-dependent DNA helicase RecG [Rikenellaceae bacterium]
MNGNLNDDITFLKGVGEQRAQLLGRELGIATVYDLLHHYPFRYIDRTKIYTIDELRSGDSALVQLRAKVISKAYSGEGRKQRFVATIFDGRSRGELIWFRGAKWIEQRIEIGQEYLIFGRPSFFRSEFSMIHPEIESMAAALSRKGESGMQGVYSTTEALSSSFGSKGLYKLVVAAWQRSGDKIAEYMPQKMCDKYNLMPLKEAIYNIHFPRSPHHLKMAQYRLKFDELFALQLPLVASNKERSLKRQGFLFARVGEAFNSFYHERLPFALTEAQKRVLREIRQDTATGSQMNRLLQGDVGSGKTIVSLLAMLLAVDNGFQACLMAPTEILARQHYASFSKLMEGSGIEVAVLTGSTKKRDRDELLRRLAEGEIKILIGTHALIEQRVAFSSLGMVVIDEQHRFGVEQRAKLWSKNERLPHVLVMTATPIPRTLAMTLYGDLDVSVIDSLPPGRKPIITRHLTDALRDRLFGFMREQIERGRQVYVVYPLIKESEGMDYKDLEDGYESIVRVFPRPEYQTTVCHGKMKPADKEFSMAQFKSGDADILVATSVIEVGVDVPNASVIVIESAERFGLSQLHQLRGRVGRGSEQSYCILMSGEKLSRDSEQRLGAMCETNDGFRLAELDLRLRGAGDVTGTQQSGTPLELRIANPALDQPILELARAAAAELMERDPALALPENRGVAELFSKLKRVEEIDFSQIS